MIKGILFRSRRAKIVTGLFVGLGLAVAALTSANAFAVVVADPGGGGGAIAQWINRNTILYDGAYYTDVNPGDAVGEFVGTGKFGACSAKLVFAIDTNPNVSTDSGVPTEASYIMNDRFYYGSDTAASSAKFIYPKGTIDVGKNLVCSDVKTIDVAVTSTANRRVTFIKMDANTVQPYNSAISFKVTTNPNLFRREDEGGQCRDMIYLTTPTSDDNGGDGADLWHQGNKIDGASVLYAVTNNSTHRQAESYGAVANNNTSCGIDNGDLYNTFSAAGNEDGGDEDKVEDFISKGLTANGGVDNNGIAKDDTFAVFVGTPDNLPKGADGKPVAPGAAQTTLNNQTCKGGALGWVICPIVSAISEISEKIKDVVASLLKVNPLPLDSTAPIYKVWENMRNIANIAFVIAFMIIIFSQATSIGLNSYGIKSMLPWLIFSAVASNLSYPICSVIIDVFNVLGVGIENLFILAGGGNTTVEVSNATGAVGLLGLGAVGVAIGIAFSTGAIVQIFPLLLVAGFAGLTTFVVLVARQGVIVLLVVASPIIVTASILPGTRTIFNKAVGLFITLMYMYPMIIGLFAAAQLASSILSQMGTSSTVGPFIAFIGLILQIVVGFSILFIFKWAIVAKGALGKLANGVNNRTSGLVNKAKERANETKFAQTRQFARDFRKQERKRAGTEEFASRMRNDAGWRRKAAGRFNPAGQQRAYIQGIGAAQKAREEEISQANLVLQNSGVQAMPELRALAEGGSARGLSAAGNPALQRAAIRRMIAAQDSTTLEQMYMSQRVDRTMLANEVREQFATVKGAGAHLVDGEVLGALDNGQVVEGSMLDSRAVTALAALSPEKLAGQDGDSARAAARGYRTGAGTPEDRDAIRRKAEAILDNPEMLKGAKEKTIQSLHEIAGRPYGPGRTLTAVPDRDRWIPGSPESPPRP